MKIVVFSDVHGATHNLQKLSPLIEQSDMTIFLGDGIGTLEILGKKAAAKIIAVRGNCDLFCPLPTEQLLEAGDKKILICHGHTYSVKSSYKELEQRVNELGADLALCGHTHRYDHEGNILNVPALKDGAYIRICSPCSQNLVHDSSCSSYIELCSMSLSFKLCSVLPGVRY